MTAISCPYCGASMNLPLKFCVSCGRPVSASDLKKFGGLKAKSKGGATKRLDENPSQANFDLARRSYRLQRLLRQFFMGIAYVLIILLGYFVAVRFVIKQTVPKNVDQYVGKLSNPNQVQEESERTPDSAQNAAVRPAVKRAARTPGKRSTR